MHMQHDLGIELLRGFNAIHMEGDATGYLNVLPLYMKNAKKAHSSALLQRIPY